MDELSEGLSRIEARARDGLEQIGFSEVSYCHRCPLGQARWIRYGVHEIASALWELRSLLK